MQFQIQSLCQNDFGYLVVLVSRKSCGRSLWMTPLGANNNKAIIRFYPYDDDRDQGPCQIWKVILESTHFYVSDHGAAVNFHIYVMNLKRDSHEQLKYYTSFANNVKICNETLKSYFLLHDNPDQT